MADSCCSDGLLITIHFLSLEKRCIFFSFYELKRAPDKVNT